MIFTKYIDIHYDNNIEYTNKTCVYNQNLLLFVMYVCMCLNKLALSFVSNIVVRGPRLRILPDLTLSAITFLSYTLVYYMSLVYEMPYWTS